METRSDLSLSIARPTTESRLALREEPEGRSPVMAQTWRDLLFLHWRYPPEQIQDTLPRGLTVDIFEGNAWVAIVPFFMCHVRPRMAPEVPRLSNFLELNVRTYVHDAAGIPGVWFYSLDANSRLAVAIARKFFHLPYFHAEMRAARDDGWIDYSCRRKEVSESCRFRYRSVEDPVEAPIDTLEFFLLERYLLYSRDAKADRFYGGRVHHRHYHFSHAEVTECSRLPLQLAGLPDPGRGPDHTCVACGDLGVSIYGLERVDREG